MALNWETLIAGALVIFGVPTAVIFLNRRRRNAGWWLLAAVIGFVIAGNIAEKLVTGTSSLF